MASNGPGQATLHVSVDFGDSSSPQSTALSSESPETATSLCFSVPPADSPYGFGADIVPKVEETEDDSVSHEDTKPLPSPPEEELECNGDAKEEKKKRRGRPRKYPRDAGPPKPAAKGRSKTGCFTCRRRKKKCDESKPHCKHCEKNNLQCEGYPQKLLWRSGKQRASIARRLSTEQPLPLPPIFEGIRGMQRDETHQRFFDNVSQVLSLCPAGQNTWIDILLPMATKHAGLMHSVLCLSGTHLLAGEPNNHFYKERREYHYGEALGLLRQNDDCTTFCNGNVSAPVDDATIAQCVIMHLASVADSRPGEDYRIFSRTARDLFKAQKASDPGFRKFLNEFFLYHDACNSITSVSHQPLSMENFQLPEYMLPKEACTYLGVMHDVFPSISNIKKLRDRMRQRWAEGLNVKPPDWSLAAKIEADLGASVCRFEDDNGPRKVASMLYHTVTWIYLHRTINQPDEQLKTVLETGLRYYRMLSEEGSALSVMLMPLFLLGCSAFWPEHRSEISDGFDNLQAYSNLGNILNAKVIVEDVWAFMDAGDAKCWDWEAIMLKHGWEFLVT